MTGDFNMRDVSWTLISQVHRCQLLSAAVSMQSWLTRFWVEISRKFWLCTDPDNVTVKNSADTLSRVDFPFHGATEFRFTIADNVVKPDDKSFYYDFKNANFDDTTNYLSRIDWEYFWANCSTVNESVDKFYDMLLTGFDQFVPPLCTQSSNHPPWYTKAIINLKNRKNRAHKNFATDDERSSAIHKAMCIVLNKEFQRLSLLRRTLVTLTACRMT